MHGVTGTDTVRGEQTGAASDDVVELAVRPLGDVAGRTFEAQERRIPAGVDGPLPQVVEGDRLPGGAGSGRGGGGHENAAVRSVMPPVWNAVGRSRSVRSVSQSRYRSRALGSGSSTYGGAGVPDAVVVDQLDVAGPEVHRQHELGSLANSSRRSRAASCSVGELRDLRAPCGRLDVRPAVVADDGTAVDGEDRALEERRRQVGLALVPPPRRGQHGGELGPAATASSNTAPALTMVDTPPASAGCTHSRPTTSRRIAVVLQALRRLVAAHLGVREVEALVLDVDEQVAGVVLRGCRCRGGCRDPSRGARASARRARRRVRPGAVRTRGRRRRRRGRQRARRRTSAAGSRARSMPPSGRSATAAVAANSSSTCAGVSSVHQS